MRAARNLGRFNQPWFDNARRLRDLVAQLHRLAVKQAETTEGWPPT